MKVRKYNADNDDEKILNLKLEEFKNSVGLTVVDDNGDWVATILEIKSNGKLKRTMAIPRDLPLKVDWTNRIELEGL